MVEVKDAGVLQVAIDDAHAVNVFAIALALGHQHADAAYDQVDHDPGLAGGIQAVDHGPVLQAVHLQRHGGGATGLRLGDLKVDQVFQSAAQVELPHQQVPEGLLGNHYVLQETEDAGHFAGQPLIGRKEAEVAVDLRGILVEVAGA